MHLSQHGVTLRLFNEMTAPGSWSWSIPKHGLLIGLRLPYFPPEHLVRRHGPANICASLATARLLSFELGRSEEHTSELQSLMRISYAVFGLNKKRKY